MWAKLELVEYVPVELKGAKTIYLNNYCSRHPPSAIIILNKPIIAVFIIHLPAQ